MIPPPLRCIQRSAEDRRAGETDSGADGQSPGAATGGTGSVRSRRSCRAGRAPNPQRDREKRGAPGSRRTANRRDEKTGWARPSGIFRGAVSSEPSRRVRSVTGRSAEASGTARMDWSEDVHPVSQGDAVQVRDGGKPCVVQPPQRDRKKRGAPGVPVPSVYPLFCRICKQSEEIS